MQHTLPDPFDAVDVVLVRRLQEQARTSLTDLAREVHLGVSATRVRVQRLEAAGLIVTYRAHVDAAKVGFALHAVVQMKVHGALFDQVDAVLADEEQITRCLRVTGQSCYVMDVVATGMADLQRITARLARIGSVTTDLVYETVLERPTPLTPTVSR